MRTLVLAGALLLATAAPAAAKGPVAVRLCGESECTRVTDRQALNALSYWTSDTVPPAEPAPYYTVDVEWAHSGSSRLYWVPSGRVLAQFYASPAVVWLALGRAGADALDEVTEDIEPLPKPALTHVFVDGKSVRGDLDTYLRLFEPRETAVVDPTETIRIALRSGRRSPWTDGVHFYYPRVDVFEAGLHPVKLPPELAARIEHAEPLEAAAGRSLRSLVAPALVIALIVAAAPALRRRVPARYRQVAR